ncbi:hypothetical protein HEP87_63030 [Streptomyces sp. S1D4-11]|nr:hypothetical protein [Streptomyces sp. S1D4-11]
MANLVRRLAGHGADGPGPYRQSHFDVFDFALTPDEVAAIDALDTGVRGGPAPDSLDLENTGFPIPGWGVPAVWISPLLTSRPCIPRHPCGADGQSERTQ